MTVKGYARDPWSRYTTGGGALLVVFVLALSMGELLFPGGTSQILSIIWWLAILVSLAGGITWLVQSRELTAEYRQLAEVMNRNDAGQTLEASTATGTVVAQRLLRIREAVSRGGPPSSTFREDWRREAVVAVESIGAAPRFIAGSLLLLAVLGTFAGMKEALPELSEAIGQTTSKQATAFSDIAPTIGGVSSAQDSGDEDEQSKLLGNALRRVASAFGANLAALLGSGVLAAMAFGLTRDARDLVRRLELVSEQSLYSRIPSNTSYDGLQTVVLNLKSTLAELGGITGSVDRLGVEMMGFTRSLNEAIGRIGSEVATVLSTEQFKGQARIERQLTEVVSSLDRVTQVIEMTGPQYEALVKGLEERDLGVRSAAISFEKAAIHFEKTNAAFATAAEQRSEDSRRANENLSAVRDAQEKLAEMTISVGQQSSTLLTQTIEATAAGQRSLQAAIEDFARRTVELMATVDRESSALMTQTLDITAEGQRNLRLTIEGFGVHTQQAAMVLERAQSSSEARESRMTELLAQLEAALTERRNIDAQLEDIMRDSKEEQLSLSMRVLQEQQSLSARMAELQEVAAARNGDGKNG